MEILKKDIQELISISKRIKWLNIRFNFHIQVKLILIFGFISLLFPARLLSGDKPVIYSHLNKTIFSIFFKQIMSESTLFKNITHLSSTPVNLSGSTSGWNPIIVGPNFDPPDDTQSNRDDVDLVGDQDNPLIFYHYYDGGTPGVNNESDDIVSIRWRLGAEGTGGGPSPKITIFTLIGMDINLDGVLDAFLIFDGGAGTKRAEVVDVGAGANDGPSTSSFLYTRNTPTTYVSYDWSVDFVSATTYAETNNYDFDNDNKTDVFVSVSMPFQKIKDFYSNVKSQTVTINTPIQFVAATATQANSINGDFGGMHDKLDDQNLTWTSLGAFSATMTFSDPADVFLDTDNDGVPDYLDLDSDNDGIPDNIEAQTIAGFIGSSSIDSNTNGLDDAYDNDAGGTAIIPVDTDSDGIPDYIDLDSDNDGIIDSIECPSLPCLDSDSNGIPNFRDTDSDGDAILDNIEAQTTAGYIAPFGNDANTNGLDDAYDSDVGGTAIIPIDTDLDGIPDYIDLDSDNDSIKDVLEGTVDTDGDSVLNFRDLDSDADGIPDNIEAQTTAGYVGLSGNDFNNNGLDDNYETAMGGTDIIPLDTDNDTIPDYLDLDSDNDAINDEDESGLPILSGFDADNDGLDDAIDTNNAQFGPVNGGITNPATQLTNSTGIGDVDYRSGGFPVSGRVYHDANHSFTYDVDESTTGLTLYAKLVKNGSVEYLASVNVLDGTYVFTNVLGGSYQFIIDDNNNVVDITPTKPTEWIPTEKYNMTIPDFTVNNYELTGINFGLYHGSTVTTFLINDNGVDGGSANNALLDGNEQTIPNVTILVKNSTETITITSAKSKGDGSSKLWIPSTYNNDDLVLTLSVPSGYQLTSNAIGNTAGIFNLAEAKLTYTFLSGVEYENIVFGLIKYSRLEATMIKETKPGSIVLIPQSFTANSSGNLTLTTSLSDSPVVPGWSEILYNDLNANGEIDTGEPLLNASISVNANDVINMVLKVTIPNTAPIGGSAIISVQADHDLTNVAITDQYNIVHQISVNDVESAGLELVKVSDKSVAKPGEQITYTITYRNKGANSISYIVINDATPPYTSFVSASYSSLPLSLTNCVITNPTVGLTGSITWTFTGTLESGQEGTVSFSIQIAN